jgi:hypothetical protein
MNVTGWMDGWMDGWTLFTCLQVVHTRWLPAPAACLLHSSTVHVCRQLCVYPSQWPSGLKAPQVAHHRLRSPSTNTSSSWRSMHTCVHWRVWCVCACVCGCCVCVCVGGWVRKDLLHNHGAASCTEPRLTCFASYSRRACCTMLNFLHLHGCVASACALNASSGRQVDLAVSLGHTPTSSCSHRKSRLGPFPVFFSFSAAHLLSAIEQLCKPAMTSLAPARRPRWVC